MTALADNGEAGGVTTAFFESMARNQNGKPSNPRKSSLEAATSQIDQLLSGKNSGETSAGNSSAATHPLKSGGYQGAPMFYSNPGGQNHFPPQNTNFSQLYPVAATPTYYPNFCNPASSPLRGNLNDTPIGSKQNGDVDLRQTPSATSSPIRAPPPPLRMQNPHHQDYDGRFSDNNYNSWKPPENDASMDPRIRGRGGAPVSFVPRRPFRARVVYRGGYEQRGSFDYRGAYRAPRAPRGHWRGRGDGFPTRDQDFRGSNEWRGGGGPRGRGSNAWHAPATFANESRNEQYAFEKSGNNSRHDSDSRTIKDVLRESRQQTEMRSKKQSSMLRTQRIQTMKT